MLVLWKNGIPTWAGCSGLKKTHDKKELNQGGSAYISLRLLSKNKEKLISLMHTMGDDLIKMNFSVSSDKDTEVDSVDFYHNKPGKELSDEESAQFFTYIKDSFEKSIKGLESKNISNQAVKIATDAIKDFPNEKYPSFVGITQDKGKLIIDLADRHLQIQGTPTYEEIKEYLENLKIEECDIDL